MPQSILLFALATFATLAGAAAPEPRSVTLSIDQDVLLLLKLAIWIGGGFLAVFALIGVTFFGWDVRKARASLADAQKETTERLRDLGADFDSMKTLKEKLEQLGAQLEESCAHQPQASSLQGNSGRSEIDIIREVIRTSDYEWTTIGRVVKLTGLQRDATLDEARKAKDIHIGTGRRTQDFMFKFRA